VLSPSGASIAVRRPTGDWAVGPLGGSLAPTAIATPSVEFSPQEDFLLGRERTGNRTVLLVEVSSGSTLFTSSGQTDGAWFAGNGTLVILDQRSSTAGNFTLSVLDLSAHRLHPIADVADAQPSPSRDLVAFRNQRAPSDLSVFDLRAHRVIPIANLVPEGGYRFSPTDDTLAYVSNVGTMHGDLWLRQPTGRSVVAGQALTSTGLSLQFSADGSRLAFDCLTSSSTVEACWTDTSTGRTINLGSTVSSSSILGSRSVAAFNEQTGNTFMVMTGTAPPKSVATGVLLQGAAPNLSSFVFATITTPTTYSVLDLATFTSRPIGTGTGAQLTFAENSASLLLAFGSQGPRRVDLVALPMGDTRSLSSSADAVAYLPGGESVVFTENGTDVFFESTTLPGRQVLPTSGLFTRVSAARHDRAALLGGGSALLVIRPRDGATAKIDANVDQEAWVSDSLILYRKGQQLLTRSLTWR